MSETNWRELPAGRELDWYIAQQLGWRLSTDPVFDDSYAYFKPDGTILDGARMLSEIGTRNALHQNWLPHYSTDLNVAWSQLFATLPDDYTPRLVRILEPRGDHMAHVNKAMILHNETMDQTEDHADAPATAVCYTWLAWKEAQL